MLLVSFPRIPLTCPRNGRSLSQAGRRLLAQLHRVVHGRRMDGAMQLERLMLQKINFGIGERNEATDNFPGLLVYVARPSSSRGLLPA